MKKEWIQHLGLARDFPRDVGFMQPDARKSFLRKSVRNAQEYVSAVTENINSRGCFVNVYSKRQQAAQEIDKLFFDIDAEDLDVSHRKWQRALQHLDHLEWDHRSVFTANKGFQVFVDFDQPVKVDWLELKDFLKRINQGAGGVFDEAVFGDKNRICRIPFTPNVKSLRHGMGVLWCVPVDRDWDMERILAASSLEKPAAPIYLAASRTARQDVDALPKTVVRAQYTNTEPLVRAINDLGPDERTYLEDLVETLLCDVAPHVQDGRHRILHFLLVPSLIQLGCHDSVIHGKCKEFIERSGKSFAREGYAVYVDSSIERNRSGDWKPLPLPKFVSDYPGILP